MAPKLSTDRFHFDPATRTFSMDASDLGCQASGFAQARALVLVSARSGVEMMFTVSRVVRDAEGEVLYTVLESVSGRGQVGSVRLYND